MNATIVYGGGASNETICDVQSYSFSERCLILHKNVVAGSGIIIIPVIMFVRVELTM